MKKKNNHSCLYNSITGRADLLRYLALYGEEGLDNVSELIGFVKKEEPVKAKRGKGISGIASFSTELSDVRMNFSPEAEAGNPPFFRIVEHKSIPDKEVVTKKPDWVENAKPFEDYIKIDEKINPPLIQDLAPWPRLWPFLKTALGKMRRTSRPDTEKMVDKISRGEWVSKLPVKKRHNWAPTCIIILDFNKHLIPFWDDINKIAEKIKNLLGDSVVKILTITDGPFGKYRKWGDIKDFGKPFSINDTNTPLLFISDLGLYSRSGNTKKQWENFGKELTKKGIKPVSLVPVPKRLWNKKISKLFNMIPWDKNINFMKEFNSLNFFEGSEIRDADERGKYLLSLLSSAIRVEPHLLRAVRFLLPNSNNSDVGAEAEAWVHNAVSASVLGFSFDTERVDDLRNKFKEEIDQKLKEEVALTIKEHHNYLSDAIWAEESQNLKFLAGVGDKKADEFIENAAVTALNEKYPDNENFKSWIKRFKIRQHDDIWQTNEKITVLCSSIDRNDDGSLKLPKGVDKNKYAWLIKPEKEPLTINITQIGNRLNFRNDTSGNKLNSNFLFGSNLGTVKTYYKNFQTFNVESDSFNGNNDQSDGSFFLPKKHSDNFKIKITTDSDEIIIKSLEKPKWAKGIGRDEFGLFVILKKSEKRLYWANPFPEFENLNGDRLWWPENIFKTFFSLPGETPTWADKFNCDEFGLYADVNIKGITQRFRWIQPGKFLMGSPEHEPERWGREVLHEVTLTKGYWIADSACTQRLWESVMGENPSRFKGKERPVENISWDDADKFIKKLNKIHPELKLRLPTEAEWEYACRAGTKTPFSFGENINTDQVNYNGNYPYNNGEKRESRNKTVEVKSLPCNDWGLYEMHGNVEEWCNDWYGEYSNEAVEDPTGPEAGDGRVLRGGSWIFNARDVRSAFRFSLWPDFRNDDIGFRLARGQ